MIIDCISDLHGFYPKMEGGDLLIIAGDCTKNDSFSGWNDFFEWLDEQNYRKKIMVAGNHDNFCTQWALSNDSIYEALVAPSSVSYLCDSGETFEGFKIWGSPWTLKFPRMNPYCKAFTVDSEEELAKKWALIPDDTDILITHGPGMGLHDQVEDMFSERIHNVGSMTLTSWRAKHVDTLKLHVYGHIHEGYGIWDVRELQKKLGDKTTPVMVNASQVNRSYYPVNPPIRVIL